MISFFNSQPLIEQQSADWILQAFEWALRHFDHNEFFSRSRLIQPTNEFFSGDVNNVHEKAENIYHHTLNYTGLAHWPFQLQKPEFYQPIAPLQLAVVDIRRDSINNGLAAIASGTPLYISYNPQQTLKPENLSSTFAHVLAQHLVAQSQLPPPGGPDYFLESTEVLAVFMGFGVMLTNSAYTFRGGCGSCYNGQSNRQATLSEDELIFCLAVYCHLKKIPATQATRHLKKHLKRNYKRAVKQINAQTGSLNKLAQFEYI
jgi:hypothetical protein